MDKNKEMLIRGILILIGVLLVIYSFYSFYLILLPIIDAVLIGNLELSISLVNFSGAITLLLIGMIVFFIGHHWDSSFKSLAITFVGIAVLFVSFSIFVYSFHTSTEEIANAVQPSLDFLVAQSIGDVLQNQLKNFKGVKVDLLLSTTQKTKKIYVSNLSINDAKLLLGSIGIKNLDESQKIYVSKFIVNSIYSDIQTNNPEFINTPIPVSYLEEKVKNQGLNFEMINSETVDLLDFFDEPNPDAYFNLLLLENEEKKSIILGNLNKKEINLIWLNLGLKNESISKKTKEIYITLILGEIAQELKTSNLKDFALPLASLSAQIPQELKSFFSYDIGTDNLTKKTQILKEMRGSCTNLKKEELDQICNIILLSDYNYLMENIDSIPTLTGAEIPPKIVKALEPFSSIQKIHTTLNKKTNYWKKLILWTIFFYILALISYYAHFKVFKRELILAKIPYFISKQNLIHIIISFLFLIIIYYLLLTGTIFEMIGNLIPSELGVNISLMSNLAIFQVLINIFSKAIFLNLIFIIFSIVIYAGLFFLLKKSIKTYNGVK